VCDKVGGEKAFALTFTLGRVFLTRYDGMTNSVTMLQPFDTPDSFFERELNEIEDALAAVHDGH
jgi:hypothetical protein